MICTCRLPDGLDSSSDWRSMLQEAAPSDTSEATANQPAFAETAESPESATLAASAATDGWLRSRDDGAGPGDRGAASFFKGPSETADDVSSVALDAAALSAAASEMSASGMRASEIGASEMRDPWSGRARPRRDRLRDKTVLKGICYAPVPLKAPAALPDDDFMSSAAKPLWGPRGRGDLAVIKSLGANAVRLYGNDPALDHRDFLDEAQAQGLQVLAGISDYPYLQMPGNCAQTRHNCFEQIKQAHMQNLKRGFLDMKTRKYHPALRVVILINEPDLKFVPAESPELFSRAVVSAFDGVLDAERAMGVKGPLPNLTATFSFGICRPCRGAGSSPGVGQMRDLRVAMQNPGSIGYSPKHDLWKAYQERFENSVNTANPARGPGGFGSLFLEAYSVHFQSTPVFIGEYHSPSTTNLLEDLEAILSLASDPSNMLTGISFFEFQVRYDKGGAEMTFGMFGLGDTRLSQVTLGSPTSATGVGTYPVWCLKALGEPPPPEPAPVCEQVQRHVVVWADGASGIDEYQVSNPDTCCAKCSSTPACKSWTWTRPLQRCRMHLVVPTDSDFLLGAVSGLPAPRSTRPDFGQSVAGPSQPHAAIAAAFGGPGPRGSALCPVGDSAGSAVRRM